MIQHFMKATYDQPTYEGAHDEGEDGDTNNRGCHVDKPVRKEGGDAEEDDVVEEIIPVLVNLQIKVYLFYLDSCALHVQICTKYA